MSDVSNVWDSYPLGNTSMEWFREVKDTVGSDGRDMEEADVAYIGGTMYAGEHKGQHPESNVAVVETNPYAVALQSLGLDTLEETGDPDQVRENLFLQPYVEESDSVEFFPDGYWMASERVEEIVGRQTEFVENNHRMPDGLAKGLNGGFDSFYGRHEEASHTDEDLRSVNMKRTNRDIFLGLPEQMEEVSQPDHIYIDPLQEADVGDRDVIFANNVPDWFNDFEDFFPAADRIGSEEGYHLAMYTTRMHGSFDSPEEVADVVTEVTGRAAQPLESEAEGTIYEHIRRNSGGEKVPYNTEDIVAGENGAIIRVE